MPSPTRDNPVRGWAPDPIRRGRHQRSLLILTGSIARAATAARLLFPAPERSIPACPL